MGRVLAGIGRGEVAGARRRRGAEKERRGGKEGMKEESEEDVRGSVLRAVRVHRRYTHPNSGSLVL